MSHDVSLCGLFLICMPYSVLGEAVLDESKLWLPKKHESHYLKLKEVATLVANTKRCNKLLEATLDLEKTTRMFVFYKVLCRDLDGRTYFETVDGKTTEILEEEKPTEEEPIEEKKPPHEIKFDLCMDRLNKQTALMKDVKYLFEQPVKFDSRNDETLHFTLPFNAKTMQGTALKYNALCSVADVIIRFDIKGR